MDFKDVFTKRYIILDQQLAQHFVKCSECLANPPCYATQIINPFLKSRSSANHKKKGRILANRGICIPLNVPLV